MKTISSLNISARLFAVFAFLYLLLSGIGYFVIVRTVNHRVEDLIVTEMENSTDAMAEIINSYGKSSIKSYLEKRVGSIVSLLEYIHGLDGSTESRKAEAGERISSVRIGDEGYAYVIDSKGDILIHPYNDLLGVNVREYDFVRKQISDPEGYLEYEWQNPGEETPREKVLYMDYFEPWDWIVTITAYKDEFRFLVRIDDLAEYLNGIQEGVSGYVYIFNTRGEIVLHPSRTGENFNTMEVRPDVDLTFFDEMKDRKSGSLRYMWLDDRDAASGEDPPEASSGQLREKMVFFQYLEEYDWVIASSVYLDEIYYVFSDIRIIILIIMIVSGLLYLLIARQLAVLITNPLKALVGFVEQSRGGDYSERINVTGSSEISKLGFQFNAFLDD